uniref:Polyprotein n=1 Tax=Ditylenchus dipsaci TaxID=166011 RepID=A0A915DWA8_9BILA
MCNTTTSSTNFYSCDLLLQYRGQRNDWGVTVLPRVRQRPIFARHKVQNQVDNLIEKCVHIAEEHTVKAQNQAKIQYDKFVKLNIIEPGDRVLLKNHIALKNTSKKFHMQWKGIYRVAAVEDMHVTILHVADPKAKALRVHIDQVKKAIEPLGPVVTMSTASTEDKQ